VLREKEVQHIEELQSGWVYTGLKPGGQNGNPGPRD
jgi:hypothetical protein